MSEVPLSKIAKPRRADMAKLFKLTMSLLAYSSIGANPGTLLAGTTKTIVSVDVPIVLTCKGRTPDCAVLCYAAVPGWFTAVPWVVPHQIQTYRCIKNAPEQAAARLVTEFKARQQAEEERRQRDPSWPGLHCLTWFGTGDGFPEAAVAINFISHEAPEITQWVRSRIPGFIAMLEPAPGLYIMGSLDGTAQSLVKKADMDGLGHPNLYYSFRRKHPDENTLGAPVIFNAKQLPGLPVDDERVCRSDAGRGPMEAACQRCRRCFSAGVHARQAHQEDRPLHERHEVVSMQPGASGASCVVEGDGLPAVGGAYVLEFELQDPLTVIAGQLGPVTLPVGPVRYYGNAYQPGGLRARIGRHLRPNGRSSIYHVDYVSCCVPIARIRTVAGGNECDLMRQDSLLAGSW